MKTSYDFTDLMLLVGTNPLPNYVVAKYFRLTNNNMQRIWLMYSEKSDFYEGTAQYAANIKAVLEEGFEKNPLKIIKCNLTDISQAEEITRLVKEHLKKRAREIKKVHLNYTGGTKAMAVHSYRALENGLKEQWLTDFSASYLDARDFRIKFDQNPEESTGDLRTLIHLKIDNLFKLHNTGQINGTKEYIDTLTSEQLEKTMQRVANLASANKIHEIRAWFNLANSSANGEPGLIDRPKNRGTRSDKDIRNMINSRLCIYSNKTHSELFALLNAFPEEDRFVNDNGKWIYDNFGISGNSNNTSKLKKFLQGTWLEAYVYWALNRKIKEEGIKRSEVFTNYDLQTIKGPGSRKFEVDVLVTNGYQICGISCGTALSKDDETTPLALKNKGFEVILRSSQMGGDEARAALVTLLEPRKVINLENDLKASLGANGSRFIVMGINDLQIDRMWKKLKKHIYD